MNYPAPRSPHRIATPDTSRGYTDLMRGTAEDGIHLYRCCLCFEAFTLDELHIRPGETVREDVCWTCGRIETTHRFAAGGDAA